VRLRKARVYPQGGGERLFRLELVPLHVPPLEEGLALQVRRERLRATGACGKAGGGEAEGVHELQGEGVALREHGARGRPQGDGGHFAAVLRPALQVGLDFRPLHADRAPDDRVDAELGRDRPRVLSGSERARGVERRHLDAGIGAQAVSHALGQEVLEPRALHGALVGEGKEGNGEPGLDDRGDRRPEEARHPSHQDGGGQSTRDDRAPAPAGRTHGAGDRGRGGGGHEGRGQRGRGVREALLDLGRGGIAEAGVALEAAEHHRVEGGRHLGDELAGGRAALARLAEGEGERAPVPRRTAAGEHLVEDDA
jgi:hypothetical protein